MTTVVLVYAMEVLVYHRLVENLLLETQIMLSLPRHLARLYKARQIAQINANNISRLITVYTYIHYILRHFIIIVFVIRLLMYIRQQL
jgi:hypothetical protein